jgi:hypothetical protein
LSRLIQATPKPLSGTSFKKKDLLGSGFFLLPGFAGRKISACQFYSAKVSFGFW